MERPPDRPQPTATSRWFCVTLVSGWAGAGAAWWSWTALGTPLPDVRAWYYSVPSWVSTAAYLGAFALLILWAIVPTVLLPVGLDYVRAAGPPGRRWRAAWLGLVATGIALEGLPFSFPMAFMSVTPNWNEFATSLGYAAVGTAMIFILAGQPIRSSRELTAAR